MEQKNISKKERDLIQTKAEIKNEIHMLSKEEKDLVQLLSEIVVANILKKAGHESPGEF